MIDAPLGKGAAPLGKGAAPLGKGACCTFKELGWTSLEKDACFTLSTSLAKDLERASVTKIAKKKGSS